MEKCIRCDIEMKEAKLTSDVAGTKAYLVNKEPGILGIEKRTLVVCMVCPKCGHIELFAKNPASLWS